MKKKSIQKNVLWKAVNRQSIENCLFIFSPTGLRIESSIVGREGKRNFTLHTFVRTNTKREVLFFTISLRYGNKFTHLQYESDGKGNWTSGNKKLPKLKGCLDIDLPLSPFTNTLPIRRLKLKMGESNLIRVLYLDLTGKGISVKRQKYTRLSKNTYLYQNVPNDFEAEVEVDSYGLVKNYPGLFIRV